MLNSRLISMLIGLGILSACGEADERKLAAQNDNGTDVSLKIDGGNEGDSATVAINLPELKGKLSLPKLELGGSDIDIGGVGLYPGARVTNVDISGQDGASGSAVVIRFQADATPASVKDYFVDAFKENGVSAKADGNRITGRDNDGKPFTINLAQSGAGTGGVIRLGQDAG